jgi:hypothetical protein
MKTIELVKILKTLDRKPITTHLREFLAQKIERELYRRASEATKQTLS